MLAHSMRCASVPAHVCQHCASEAAVYLACRDEHYVRSNYAAAPAFLRDPANALMVPKHIHALRHETFVSHRSRGCC